MLYLREFRAHPDRLSDLLPWAALVAPAVVLNKDGSFQTTIRFRGPDLDSATDVELLAASLRVNNVFRRLGSGWAIYAEARRSVSKSYPQSAFPDPVSYLIDEERRLLFEKLSHFESEYFLSLVYLPPSEKVQKLGAQFVQSNSTSTGYKEELSYFQDEVCRIVDLLETTVPEVTRLSDDEILSYLHGIISDKRHPVLTPEVPMYLDAVLSDSPVVGGFEPKLGTHYLSVVSLQGFPAKSQPCILDRLDRLSCEYRWVTRFISLNSREAEAELSRYKRQWFAKRKSVATLIKETFFGVESVLADTDAVNKALDADEALQELGSEAVSYGYFTASVVLADEDQNRVKTKAREVERAINSLGFCARIETTNALDAWLGTIPGNCRNNVRRPLLNTQNLSHLLPLSALWAGPQEDEHLRGPALFYARTSGSTQFRFSLHVADVGHTLVLGPTGAGKSVLLNLMEAQFRRYPDAQVYVFDKGGSAKVLTLALGGDYYELGSDSSPIYFQPLSSVDNPAERRWAHDWVCELLQGEQIPVISQVKAEVWTALNSLATAKQSERTLFGLTVLLQNQELRTALLPFTLQGPHGNLLDKSHETLSSGDFQTFELEQLMETPVVVAPVLSYLFHRLEARFSGRPTLLVLDEAWLFLDNTAFASRIRQWLKVLRKKNVSVVFATQSLSDVEESPLAAVIKESCFTRIYLPNPTALTPSGAHFYEQFGLNNRQIDIIARGVPKREYYLTSPHGNRLFELSLGELALAYCGATSKERQKLAATLREQALDTDSFNRSYLSACGLNWASDLIPEAKKVEGLLT